MFQFIKNTLKKREGKSEYQNLVIKSLEDGILDDNEKKELERIKKEYDLADEDILNAQRLGSELLFNKIAEDHRITDEEKEEFYQICDYLDIPKENDITSSIQFKKYQLLAYIDQGILPILPENVQSPILLKKDERLRSICDASLVKNKMVTQKINYGGLTTSIRIMKGVHYRVGSVKIQNVKKEIVVTEDTGQFFITTEGLGFKGNKKHFSIPFTRIAQIELVGSYLQIFKNGKEAPYIVDMQNDNLEINITLLSKIINSL